MTEYSPRQIDLAGKVPGKLFRSPMPGRYGPLQECEVALQREGITLVVCLAPTAEIEKKSPEYALRLEEKTFPIPVRHFPIPDFGVPEDVEEFLDLVQDLALRLRKGENILIHCGAGIGRTGTTAIATLMALGFHYEEAKKRASDAGAHPEGDQESFLIELVRWLK